jgi:hypothetical protein
LYKAATIRRRYLKPPPLAKPTVPRVFDSDDQLNNDIILSTVIDDDESRPLTNLQQLHAWLVEQLKSSGRPMSLGEVQIQFKAIVGSNDGESTKDTTRESAHRDRLRARLEKRYPNQFMFITPNKREGTFVALNNIEHYVRHAIKIAKEEKEKAAAVIYQSVFRDNKELFDLYFRSWSRRLSLFLQRPFPVRVTPVKQL